MNTLSLKFDNLTEIIDIDLIPEINGKFFKDYLISLCRPADRVEYTKTPQEIIKDFLTRANKAAQLFNFNWDLKDISQDNCNLWHRDIETFDLSKHPPWSQEKGDFFVDLHHALHQVEHKHFSTLVNTTRTRIQVRWLAPSVPWPQVPKFTPRSRLQPGDIITDYPHVGKSPFISMQHNDITQLKQSCKLPDCCPPSFYILLACPQYVDTLAGEKQQKEENDLIDWYQNNADALCNNFTKEQMLEYNGEYCIGRLKNLEHIKLLSTSDLHSVAII